MKLTIKEHWKRSRYLILIFFSMALLMIVSALVELNQSKSELLHLMEEQSHALLESLISASNNLLKSNDNLEMNYRDRLLNNANIIRRLYETGMLKKNLLRSISELNHIHRIHIYSPRGEILLSTVDPGNSADLAEFDIHTMLTPIFQNQADSIIIGLRRARSIPGYRYIVAVATRNRDAIVLNVDAGPLVESRRQSGFGMLLRNIVSDNPQIIYSCLQDTNTILAASGNVRFLEPITSSQFLSDAFLNHTFASRVAEFDSTNVFEAVLPFDHNGFTVGLFRVGLSVHPLDEINDRIYRRLIIISVILIVTGSLIISLIFIRQRFDLTQRRLEIVETYSGSILENVSDAIIVSNHLQGIQVLNTSAEKIFGVKAEDIRGNTIQNFFKDLKCQQEYTENFSTRQIDCLISDSMKNLLVTRTAFRDDTGTTNDIYVFRDLTEQKKLEEQLARRERLTAMGELAAGVAHEIRNPLNSISTIIQQLDRDFEPNDETDDYHELTGIVINEVKRINRTVQDFLTFSRPEPLNPSPFKLSDMMYQLRRQFDTILKKHGIDFNMDLNWDGIVTWDQSQITQVLINLIKNASEAIGENGILHITTGYTPNRMVEITVKDTGPGIPEDLQKRIFNLYFTTKASGTGIGLSIVQRIVDEHGGTIQLHSVPDEGTTFTLTLPETCSGLLNT